MLNAFTPFGDASLIRMANLYANVAQLGRREDFERCFDMITTAAARLMNLDGYGLALGDRADLVVLPSPSAAAAIRELAQPAWASNAAARASCGRPPSSTPRPRTSAAQAGAPAPRRKTGRSFACAFDRQQACNGPAKELAPRGLRARRVETAK